MFDVRSRLTIIFMWFFYLSYTLRAVFLFLLKMLQIDSHLDSHPPFY